jgi:hypothetical protein
MGENFLQRFIFEEKYQVPRHLIFWILGAGLIPTVLYGLTSRDFIGPLKVTLCMLPVEMAYTYGLLLWLLPSYLQKGRYVRFFFLLVVWAVIAQWLTTLVNVFVLVPLLYGVKRPELQIGMLWHFDWYQLILTNGIAAVAVFIYMFRKWHFEWQDKLLANREKINTELLLLKAQINPHFLFNTLNNLYTLVYEKSDKAPAMLLRLSGLLSYVLYECKSERVPLEKEIAVMKDYVMLEKERYGDRLDISFSANGAFDNATVAPLLFQPFIENAFKHGTSEQIGKVWMSIEFSLRDNQLFFGVINSCEHPANPAIGCNGIGINNVKKRLDILHPEKYQLQYGYEGDVYAVSLFIDLEQESGYSFSSSMNGFSKRKSYETSMFTGR